MKNAPAEIAISDLQTVIPEDTKSEAGRDDKESDSSSMAQSTLNLLVVLAIVVSIVAIILSAVSLTRNSVVVNYGSSEGDSSSSSASTGSSGSSSSDDDNSDEIWTFAIGHDGTNVEYIDDTTGTLRGFHVDLVNAVCSEARKNCRLIWDIYENCWDSEAGQRARGGKGLMSGWYDACTGWFNTYERALTVQFSGDFRQGLNAVFFVRLGNPGNFDATNIESSQKIGFIDGWASDEHCLGRTSSITGVPLDTTQVVHYGTREELQAAVENSEVAAGFTNTNTYQDSELMAIGAQVNTCYLGGAAMMSRKDSKLNDWFNPALATIKSNGVYQGICDTVTTDHGHQPGATGDLLCV